MALELIWLNEIDSTQSYLVSCLKNGELTPNIAVGTDNQTSGKGRRGDEWQFFKGSLALSLAIKKDNLPTNMPITATAIFAGFVLKKLLNNLGSKCWMKWPNDLYIEDRKLAGIIAMQNGETIIFGIGLNKDSLNANFAKSDIIFNAKELANTYITMMLGGYDWDLLFMEIEVECKYNLERLKKHYNLSSDVEICYDGGLMIDGRKVYTLT
ncbi:MAG: hypothetical protein RL154_1611 [Pseudomonadota bacterium]